MIEAMPFLHPTTMIAGSLAVESDLRYVLQMPVSRYALLELNTYTARNQHRHYMTHLFAYLRYREATRVIMTFKPMKALRIPRSFHLLSNDNPS